jgi:hypothetical protein
MNTMVNVDTIPPPHAIAAAGAPKVVARDVNVYYGEKHALKHVSIDVPERSVHVSALHQPDERHDPDRPGHRPDRGR